MRRRLLPPLVVAGLLLAGCAGASDEGGQPGGQPGGQQDNQQDNQQDGGQEADTTTATREAGPMQVARDLQVPWGLDFLPGGDAVVTLRDSGEVLRVSPGADPVSLGTIEEVAAMGEGGLLGIAVSPEFENDRHVFVYLTTDDDNRVLRMTLSEDNGLAPDEVIVDGIPNGSIHNGGRIAFGPDGYLYVATGDAGDGGNAQDPNSLGGKILRVDGDGEPPDDNPDPGSPVWTLGHRNVQGLAWDEQGRMFASEFGQNTWDELNRIEAGRNYGWPEVEGIGDGGSPEEFTDPLYQWTPDEASPSGIAVGTDGTDDAIYMAALRGQSLWRIPLQDEGIGEPARLLEGELGRLRAVRTGPDDRLWVVTSNTFRGEPAEDDDQIITYDPAMFTP